MNHYFNRILKSISSLICINLIYICSGYAQVLTADISGYIYDQNAAVIVNAKITARNRHTGYTRICQTNNQGSYTINQLPPGPYELLVEAPTFSKLIVKDYYLNIGAKQTLNLELNPGTITETVEASNMSLHVETTKSEIGGTINPTEVLQLPLINRTFAALAVIMPEARPANNFDPTKSRIGNVAFNGGDGRQISISVDGGDNKDNVVGSLLQNFAYESIQEFQILHHSWTAESGRAVGGIINVVTKSGSNTIHGSFFVNLLDESLRAKSFFERRDDKNKPNFNRQEMGGSLGGPIIRDRLFYFGAFELFRERQSIFTPTNVLSQLAAIPDAQPLDVIPAPYHDMMFTAKLDHRLANSRTMFYRFSQQNNHSHNDQISDPANTDLTGGNTSKNDSYSFVVNYNWAISPRKMNQWLFSFQDYKNQILRVTDSPNLTFPGNIQTGANVNVPQSTLEKKFQLRDDLSLLKDRHTLKLGVNYIYTKLDGFYYPAKGYQLTFFDGPTTIRNNTNGRYPHGFATPGAVRTLTYSDGNATHNQSFHQLALYIQDDYKIARHLTLNLGLRWDVNIGSLVDQTENRTIKILRQIDNPLARAITGNPERLKRRTPSWLEFQPRFGIAFDPTGSGRTVIRGGFGIYYDQLFQNLTFFSLQQTRPDIFQSLFLLTNTDVGVGDPFLRNFRYGIDPLPQPPPGVTTNDLVLGAFGRINDPDMQDPYVQKFSVGVQTTLGLNMTISSDYVHARGTNEPRVQVINPQIRSICNSAFPGSNPSSPLCVREASGGVSRRFDRAFLNSGLGVNRLGQINMISTNNRSLFDSWTTQFKYRTRRIFFSAGYVLSMSRSWGGQATASYNGNSIAIAPEQQFRAEEFGPTRFDERHRLVASGVLDLPYRFQIAHIFQLASARPYSPTTGLDIDGDGLAINDRLCARVDPIAVFNVRGNSAAVLELNPLGCTQSRVNSMRDGFVIDSAGNVIRRSARYFNLDLRVSKKISISESLDIYSYVNIYNVFNSENLSFAERRSVSPATSSEFFLQPFSLYGSGFGQSIGRPLTFQLGFRLSF